ncbi:hypothetical protein IL306_014817 [Fusarium sp. DS 682]|nr:hypothetical protein IL306_014817 [Fusarium sp. DS 682]
MSTSSPLSASGNAIEQLLNSVPVNLMTAHFKNYLFYNSNGRLEEAKQQGLTLNDISIGNDCLPTWPYRTWDSNYESLHNFLQDDLLNLHEAREAGIMVCGDIIWKSNRKLDEARALGGAAAEEAILFLPKQDDGDDIHSSPEGSIVEDTETSEGTLADESAEFIDVDISLAHDSPDISDRGSDYDSDYYSDSDGSDSEMSFEMVQNDDNSINDGVQEYNIFDPEPMFDDSDDDEQHIFHGAEVVGLPAQHANVDLEVYIAEDDEEIKDLPKMELVVDQESFERYFGIDGAIELEIVGGRLICTGELYEEEQEMLLDDMTDAMADDMADVSLVDLGEEFLEGQYLGERGEEEL